MSELTTSSGAIGAEEEIPEYAYSWRPFACREMLYIDARSPAGSATFIVDPWNQHWLIARQPVVALLKRADGLTRFSQLLRELRGTPGLAPPPQGYVALAAELAELGLLFNCRESHAASGGPVYNASPLVGMHLEVTNACNMTCEHCYVSSGHKLQNELSLDEVKAIIDMLPPFTGKRIALSGGEPAARKDLDQIITYCVERGHDVDVYTNGKRFPRRLAQHIYNLNERSTRSVRIQVSLEGATPATNDAIRGQGSFAHALETLTMLKEIGIQQKVVLFVCLTAHNILELEELVRLAERFDVGMLVFSQWQKQGNAANVPWSSLAPSDEDWVRAGEFILNYENPRLVLHGNFFGDISNDPVTRFNLDAPLFPKHRYFYNAFPRISPNGDVWADQLWVDPSWRLGNLRSGRLQSCFESPKFHEQLEAMREREIAECNGCMWKPLCEGGSPGHTFAEYDGNMNHRDLFCGARVYWFERFVRHQLEQALGGTVDVSFRRPASSELARANTGNRRRLAVFGSPRATAERRPSV